jgi:excisionase family DNA binding protein
MMIEFYCSECGKYLKVGNDAAGKRGKCPKCGASLLVPETEIVTLEAADVRQPLPQPPVIAPPKPQAGVQIPPAGSTSDKLLTAKEVAEILNVSPRTLAELTKTGELVSVKLARLRRYTHEDVKKFIDQCRTKTDK